MKYNPRIFLFTLLIASAQFATAGPMEEKPVVEESGCTFDITEPDTLEGCVSDDLEDPLQVYPFYVYGLHEDYLEWVIGVLPTMYSTPVKGDDYKDDELYKQVRYILTTQEDYKKYLHFSNEYCSEGGLKIVAGELGYSDKFVSIPSDVLSNSGDYLSTTLDLLSAPDGTQYIMKNLEFTCEQ